MDEVIFHMAIQASPFQNQQFLTIPMHITVSPLWDDFTFPLISQISKQVRAAVKKF